MDNQIGLGIASSLLASAVTGGSVYAWKHREHASEYITQAKVYIEAVVATPSQAKGTELANMVHLAEEGLARVLAAHDGRTDLVQSYSGGAEEGISRILALQSGRGGAVQVHSAVDSIGCPASGVCGDLMASNGAPHEVGLFQSFVPAEGIDRDVISTHIQEHLGPDASVRPGSSNGVRGYWIRAFRALTNPMINDLKSDTVRWRQEQSRNGTNDPYVGSSAHYASTTERLRQYGISSPIEEHWGGYSLSQVSVLPGRGPASEGSPAPRSMPARDCMEVDLQSGSKSNRRSGQTDRADQGEQQPESQPPYRVEQHITTIADGRTPVAPAHGSAAGYALDPQQVHDGSPPGYMRQGNYYVPNNSGVRRRQR